MGSQAGMSDGVGSGPSTGGLGWECSLVLVWVPELQTASLPVSPSQGSSWASLPDGSDPVFSRVPDTQHCPSCLLVGLLHLYFIRVARNVARNVSRRGIGLGEWSAPV